MNPAGRVTGAVDASAGVGQDVGRPAVAADVDAEPGAVEAEAVAQDLGAGELADLVALGERGGGLLEVDPIDLDPAVARSHERAGLLGELGDLGGGQLDVVEQHRPRHVAELVGADHGVRRLGEAAGASASPCGATSSAPGRRSRRRRASDRSSSSAPTPGPGSAPADRAEARSTVRWREGPAQSVPLGRERAPAALLSQRGVDRNRLAGTRGGQDRDQPHPGLAGCIELHDELGRDVDVTPRVQRSRAWATSSMSRFGAWNGEPSMRAITASCTSRGDRTVGGAAGSSIRSTLSATIASTTAVRTAVVVARPLSRPMIATGPGMAAARAAMVGLSTSAGRHRTSAVACWPRGPDRTRSVGTIDPDAVRRTPS